MPKESNYQGPQFYVAKKKTTTESVVITQNINLMKPSKTGQNPEPIIAHAQFSEILKQINLEIAIAKTSHNDKCTERYYQDDLRIVLICACILHKIYMCIYIYIHIFVYMQIFKYQEDHEDKSGDPDKWLSLFLEQRKSLFTK